MPELPEVESIKNSIKPSISGKKIAQIEVLSTKNFVGDPDSVIGMKIVSVDRYGKVLILKLKNPQTRKPSQYKYLNIHFKLSGQMLYARHVDKAIYKHLIPFVKDNKMPGKTTRVIIVFDDASALFFNDLRKFGWIKVSEKPLIPKGVDVMSKKFTVKYLTYVLQSVHRPVKIVLMDQDKITGIGNIYANDSLYEAGIGPTRIAKDIKKTEIKKLHTAILKEIKLGIKDKGSSGADEAFILPDGSRGNHQRRFLVYQREDEKCLRCNSKIKRIKQGGRSSFFCPNCQK